MSDSLDRTHAARVLRDLAAEIRTVEGAARNGLFLELHRLLDTIFRLTLESLPELPPDLQGSAFNLENPMPAPQVVRELNRLGSPLASTEIRNLYKHMNMARNNMAHEPVIGRVTVSNGNVKRMAELAERVASVLDPSGAGHRVPATFTKNRLPVSRARLYLLTGAVGALAITLAWTQGDGAMVSTAVTVVVLAVLAGAWLAGD